MSPASLAGAQRTQLRGLGQTMPDSLQVGREGATVTLIAQLECVLAQRELVKVCITGGQDRHARAALHTALALATRSECVGAVGHTALFWRAGPEGSKLLTVPHDAG